MPHVPQPPAPEKSPHHVHLSSGHRDHNTTTAGDIPSCAPRRSQEATHQHVWPHRQEPPQQSAATITVDISTFASSSAEWSHKDVTAHTGYTSATHAFHSGIKAIQLVPEHSTQCCSPATKQHQEMFPRSTNKVFTKFKVKQTEFAKVLFPSDDFQCNI